MQNRAEQSIRLFKNDFLESLTHVHPITPLLFWSPIVLFLLWRSVNVYELTLGALISVGLIGVLTWSLAEYSIHRFLFHFPAKRPTTKYLVFLFHGIHHATPQVKTRLVMPPLGGAIIMALLWGIFSLFIPDPWLEPFMASFVVGYLIYDYTHYAVHHFPMRGRIGHYLKRHHMQHHFKTSSANFGVSSPLWDWVFGTTLSR